MKKVALVTYSDEPRLTADDRLVIDYLISCGAIIEIVCWDSKSIDWKGFDQVVLRSCWEYHLRTDEFLNWISEMEKLRVPLHNSVDTIRWNIDKFYLRDLAEKGVTIPASIWIKKGEKVDLSAILAEKGWTRAVVKPAISMSAFQTWITEPSKAQQDQLEIERMLETSGIIIQKFIGQVKTVGEWSFVFLGGKYSHAVLKRPQKGDFRVQRDFGGSVDMNFEPDPSLIEQAKEICGLLSEPLLYARVDGVNVNGTLMLMELELIDPVLFLGFDRYAAARFAEAILCS